MIKRLKQLLHSNSVRRRLGIMILAAILLQIILGAQHYYTRGLLSKELERHAESELTMKAILIKGMLSTTEKSARDHLWEIKHNIKNPDSMYIAMKRMVIKNRYLVGSGIGFSPNYYPQKGVLFEPYAQKVGDDIVTKQISGKNHDYTKMAFYRNVMEGGKGSWSDPYVDSVGNNQLITTYSLPIHEWAGKFVGAFGIDMSLEWLSDTINARHAYPSSFNILLTEGGGLIVKPSPKHPKTCDVDQVVALVNDSTVQRDSSSTGRSKTITFKSLADGSTGRIYYANMRGDPHWQIVVVSYDNEVYSALDTVTKNILLLMLAGFIIMAFIVLNFALSERKLQRASLEQERIGSELRIASSIQQSLLPRDIEAMVARNEIDVCSKLEPAREVGGDLYDYFVRDEKLFFCIGDVSGKGVPSALVMALTEALFHSSSQNISQPAHIIQDINRSLNRNNDRNMFVTFFVGVLDLPTGRLRYCNAGHNPPVLIDDEVRFVDVKPNLPLGVIDDFKFEVQEIILPPGSMLFLYTDGLTEAMNSAHSQFGEERLLATLRRHAGNTYTTSQLFVDDVTEQMRNFTQGAEQSDDLTLLAIRYTPKLYDEVLSESITLDNDVKQIPQLNAFVADVTSRLSMEPAMAHQMKLAVEEAVVNVMQYAYPRGTHGIVDVEAKSNGECLKFIISDKGTPFDPTAATEADTTLSVEERPIGGLGIFLVRQMMDSINYEHLDGKNILTLRKYYNKLQ